ncbi:hypothetical protein SBOR_8483 [Sclerotinia borealis F-4128]|uniref:DNA-directed RNA polymerases I, II, and III subunit RPABC1 n=1 Tax=Sclerotinia borealis (strain F-4128) TaxID=1432307 RepID=W9C8C5_SCLBF|nr:hypothetical protein SBOR_8483 [Sclerotinia borealis F-4128]
MADDEDRAQKQRDGIDRDAAKLWRCYRTVHEMVQDRGYLLAEEEVNMSFDTFKAKFTSNDGSVDRRQMNFSATPSEAMIAKYANAPTPENPNPTTSEIGSIWIEFLMVSDVSIGIKQMRTFAQHLSTNSFSAGILIAPVAPSGPAAKIIPAVASSTRIETFVEQDLLVNITHHELVPKHVLLSKEERAKLLSRYRLKDTQLPRIQAADPVAKYLGLRRGQVVKIIRKSETAGRYASYRLCV